MTETIINATSCVTLHYRLGANGVKDWVNTFTQKPATFTLGLGQLATPFEQLLKGLKGGEHHIFKLKAAEAFGAYHEDLVYRLSYAYLQQYGKHDEHYAVGEVVNFQVEEGAYAGVVKHIEKDGVMFDFNHPLAGLDIEFEVKIVSVL